MPYSDPVNILYLGVSAMLLITVGQVLSRSWRAFLRQVLGRNDAAALAVRRVMVVMFYLVGLGVIVLARPSEPVVINGGQAAQLVATRTAVLALALGAVLVACMLAMAQAWRGQAQPAGPARPES